MNVQPPPGDQNPAPYPYRQPPPAAPPPTPPPPKRGKAWLWILLGAAGLVLLCCGIVGVTILNKDDNGSNGGQGGQAETPNPQATNPGIGDAVRDGKFEFVVNEVECGVDRVGTPSLGQQAQGQFCLVTLSVKNIGDEPQTLSDSDQKGKGTNGSEYSSDTVASTYANDVNNQVWQTEINPGNEVTGVVVYDLPDGVDLAQLELHDSAFSDGVTVDLK